MRRFQFRVEKLLWHRSLQEELAEQALSRSLHEAREVEEAVARVKTQAAAVADRLRSLLAGVATGGDLALHWNHQSGLHSRELALEARRAAAALRVDEDRATLRDRRRRREVVAQLKTEAAARYRAEAEREAQKILDDVAGGRHIQTAQDGGS